MELYQAQQYWCISFTQVGMMLQCRFNPSWNRVFFLIEIKNLDLHFIWKCKESTVPTAALKLDRAGGLILPGHDLLQIYSGQDNRVSV